MNRKQLAILGLILSATIATAAAVVYVIDSNTAHIQWVLTCAGHPVCVLFGILGGNSTLVNYSIRILSTQTLSNQYINTTVYSGPANIIYNLNGTTGTRWLFGPYIFNQNVFYAYNFVLHYNGTAGSYDFAVNVLQAQ